MPDLQWTPQQAAAITETRHALLVANAGTGKTATVVGKIRWLLGLALEPARAQTSGSGHDDGGNPAVATSDLLPCPDPCSLREIAAITFTEKAAYDLKRKLRESIMASERADELRWQIDRATIGTIHGFCGELLREHALRLEIDPTFRVLDQREAWTAQDDLIVGVVKEALAEGDEGAGLLLRSYKLTSGTYQKGVVDYVRAAMADLRWHAERYVHWTAADGGLDDEALQRLAGEWDVEKDGPTLRQTEALVRLARHALSHWQQYLADENARDFDALILDARALLTGPNAAAALDGIRRRYRILIIDEFQDTDGAQRDIAFAIAGLLENATRIATPVDRRLDMATGEGRATASDRGPIDEELATPTLNPVDNQPNDRAISNSRATTRDTSLVASLDDSLAGTPITRPQLFIVGDPKQSIYRFRGADISVWNEVAATVGRRGVALALTENFRCAPPIVNFVNAALSCAMTAVGEKIDEQQLGSRIPYADLVTGVGESATARLEWLVAEKRTEKANGDVTIGANLAAEAAQVAARISEMVGEEEITDPDTGQRRPVAFRDIAVLYRGRNVLGDFEAALSRQGVPCTIAGAPHLGSRQEILDLLNLLRLLRNPRDDYRAFGFLRSPFVALRDEVITHIALNGKGPSLLLKARRFLQADREGSEWFDGPEGLAVSALERAALARALDTVADARALVHRVPLDEVLQLVLDSLGYSLHLLVRGSFQGASAEEPLANIQSFLQFTEQYRDLDVSTFLEVWDRWDAQDNGLPQAPLYSKDDDVVTLTTIHRAKGLEWPVVFLVGTGTQRTDHATHSYWSDPTLGPLLCPSQDDRGERTWRLWHRSDAEDHAEDTRLLYVATTRARDRLLIVGPREREKSYSEWLSAGVHGNPFHIREEVPEAAAGAAGPSPTLAWLEDLNLCTPPPLLQPTPESLPRFVVSATELMGRAKDEHTWRLRYRHGVQPKWEFAGQFEEGTLEGEEGEEAETAGPVAAEPSPAGTATPRNVAPRIPATVRGTVIHGVLERIQSEVELSRLLHETIGGLDDPDLEEALEVEEYRQALEDEIRRVVRSEEWAWYVAGEHYRELEFVHLAGEREWRVGAFDLYRPGPPGWVIDFKTHEIEAEEAARVARDYDIQVEVYREAGGVRDETTVALHFTGPNTVV